MCALVRILIFHGYLLEGTGSNVYNARLAEALVGLGHEVHLLSQERHPERLRFVDAAGDWDGGVLRVRKLTDGPSARCTVYRPNIGPLLPVYVADRYEGIEARTFAECSDEQIARYVDANVAAVRELAELVRPQLALANHLVMGPVILARGLRGEVAYVVKVHGSALEYTVKPQPERFLGFAREGLADARAVLVGSRHTALSLWTALYDAALEQRTWLGPPGVDVARFAPRDSAAAAAGVSELSASMRAAADAERGAGAPGGALEASAFARDTAAVAQALERIAADSEQLVAFVGKLIVSKGVDLLLAAWPLVLERQPRARLVIVGFGAYREAFERMLAALARGDLEAVRDIALAGRALERDPAGEGGEAAGGELASQGDGGAPSRPLRHLLAFLEGLGGERRERYLAAARGIPGSVLLTGRLEHEELVELLPACQALVVPSTFPESFGMVAAEAAACGVLPISAAHSGLAEVSEALAQALGPRIAGLLSFPVDERSVQAIAERVTGWLEAPAEERAQARTGLVRTVSERWSWQSVARGIIAAGTGAVGTLERP